MAPNSGKAHCGLADTEYHHVCGRLCVYGAYIYIDIDTDIACIVVADAASTAGSAVHAHTLKTKN